MQIIKEIQFDYGHCVTYHQSACKNLHGHRARVLITVEGDLVSVDGNEEFGMVMDFSRIKALAMKHVHAKLDHSFIIWAKDHRAKTIEEISDNVVITDFVPTAENLAKWIFDTLSEKITDEFNTGLKLVEIQFFETPTSCAIYHLNKR